jgi:hypothetical protein
MPVIKCTDCGKGRRYRRPPAIARCKTCAKSHAIALQASRREEFKRKKLCRWCGDGLSAHSIFFCDRCAGYHAGYQARAAAELKTPCAAEG